MVAAATLIDTLSACLGFPQAGAYWRALQEADLLPEDIGPPSAARLLLATLGGNTPADGPDAVRVYGQLNALGAYHSDRKEWQWIEASELLADDTHERRAEQICGSVLSLIEVLIFDAATGWTQTLERQRLTVSRDLSAPVAYWQVPLSGTGFTATWVYAPAGVDPMRAMLRDDGLQVTAATSGRVIVALGELFRNIRPGLLMGLHDPDLSAVLHSTPPRTIQ